MPSVKVRDNEPFDIALRRFKRSVEKAGVLAAARTQTERPQARTQGNDPGSWDVRYDDVQK